ncbi:globin-coupled sensor protein [Telmatospirillum sp.]|uniref:globin-coupled sensor protein n=1 Tax=Telmatospirillum sp. TaxID=2079197 RepID=UPI00284FC995|nr:globin-coupled sensor protein [Telmatospirillum sp.]MDR3435853.1 globin-coupled sensor protein [Telmatospirillum sp.]
MDMGLDKNERLSFLLIDDETRAALRELRPILAENIETILDDFYRHVQRTPEAAKTFANNSIEKARRLQKQHWLDNVFSGKFDEAYFIQVKKIGEAHARIGLEPRWYTAAYGFILNKIVALVCSKNRKTPDRIAPLLCAVNKVAFLDMDLSVSVYIDTLHQKLTEQASSFERDVSSVVGIVAAATNELQMTARSMVSTADQTAQQASAVAAAAGNASENVQTVAAATEQLSSSIHEINRQVSQSNQIATSAVDEAERTNQKMRGLTEAAQRIGEVVKLINNIASQTNLLALNATIEAARAGEAGKGFAVVAGEVKSLANQTAKATDDISAQILAVQNATKEAVSAIVGIGSTITKMNEIISAIAAAVEQQGAATKDIARNIQLAATGTDEVSSHIGAVTVATGETGHAAREVRTASSELAKQSDRLSVQVDSFLTMIRGT